MKKQNYSKPYMAMERFMPQDYCVVCSHPGRYRIYCPNIETNKLDGWQDHNIRIDDVLYENDQKYQNNWWIYFDDHMVENVRGDRYPHDYESNYWQNTLKTPGIMIYEHNGQVTVGETWAPGTIIYKNQGNSISLGGAEETPGGKNAS